MEKQYLEDLKDIRAMMHRSSRFISLSGLAGISAGIIALVGAYIAHVMVLNELYIDDHQLVVLPTGALLNLLFISISTLILAIGVTIYFTRRSYHKKNEKIWDHHTRRMLTSLLIPLVTGGVFSLMLILRGYVSIGIPITLIFYGLALVSASKYTLADIQNLGLIEILIGLLAFQWVKFGLILWAIGFGVMHIVYGIWMNQKYNS